MNAKRAAAHLDRANELLSARYGMEFGQLPKYDPGDKSKKCRMVPKPSCPNNYTYERSPNMPQSKCRSCATIASLRLAQNDDEDFRQAYQIYKHMLPLVPGNGDAKSSKAKKRQQAQDHADDPEDDLPLRTLFPKTPGNSNAQSSKAKRQRQVQDPEDDPEDDLPLTTLFPKTPGNGDAKSSKPYYYPNYTKPKQKQKARDADDLEKEWREELHHYRSEKAKKKGHRKEQILDDDDDDKGNKPIYVPRRKNIILHDGEYEV